MSRFCRQELNVQVGTEEQLQENPAYRYFVHGSASGAWKDLSAIDPRKGSGDFGAAFYAFQVSARGVAAASARAKTTQKRLGGKGFLLVVRMETAYWNALNVKQYPGPNGDWLNEVTRQRVQFQGAGSSNFDITAGPVAWLNHRTDSWEANPDPLVAGLDQYAFSSPSATRPDKLQPVMIIRI